jgi:replication factor A1
MGGPTVRNNGAQRIVPIDSLTPYTNKWAIKARVTSKSDLRRYQNARGEGKVFSFDLLDNNRGEIRATCFNDAADRFYDTVHVGKVYIISRGQLKPARKQFSTLANDFEIGMEASSQVEEVPDDAGIMDKIYHFKSIEEVERQEKNKCLDVVGVVQSVDAWQTIQTRAGAETQKRAVYLRDDTGRSVELTLWGSLVQTPGAQLEADVQQGRHPILAAKGVRVGDFNGKNLGTISSSQLDVDPEHPRAHQLRQWYDNGGAQEAALPPLSPWGPSRRRLRSWAALGSPHACGPAPTSPISAPSPSRTQRARCPLMPPGRAPRLGAPATRSACPSGRTTRPV